MNDILWNLAHQAFFGGIAAAGFGVLFNIGTRDLFLCLCAGAFALCVRTVGLNATWTLEAATFVAALSLSTIATLSLKHRRDSSGEMIALAGCIPMIPGAFLTKAILSLFALTAAAGANEPSAVITATEYILRVGFTIFAIGTGFALPAHLFQVEASLIQPPPNRRSPS